MWFSLNANESVSSIPLNSGIELANSVLIIILTKFVTLEINLLAIESDKKTADSKQYYSIQHKSLCSLQCILKSIIRLRWLLLTKQMDMCNAIALTVTKNTVEMDFYLFMIFHIFRDSTRTFVIK